MPDRKQVHNNYKKGVAEEHKIERDLTAKILKGFEVLRQKNHERCALCGWLPCLDGCALGDGERAAKELYSNFT